MAEGGEDIRCAEIPGGTVPSFPTKSLTFTQSLATALIIPFRLYY